MKSDRYSLPLSTPSPGQVRTGFISQPGVLGKVVGVSSSESWGNNGASLMGCLGLHVFVPPNLYVETLTSNGMVLGDVVFGR